MFPFYIILSESSTRHKCSVYSLQRICNLINQLLGFIPSKAWICDRLAIASGSDLLVSILDITFNHQSFHKTANIFGYFTASAFVVNKERNKMVVVYHIINDGWIYPGGHADGEEDLLKVAVREVEEETGLKVRVLDDNIYAID